MPVKYKKKGYRPAFRKRESFLRLWRNGYISDAELYELLYDNGGFTVKSDLIAWIKKFTDPNYTPRQYKKPKETAKQSFTIADREKVHTNLLTLEDLLKARSNS